MPDPNPAVMDFLLSRRSRPARTLSLPIPGRDQILRILTAAARVPDHGKLEPWRFLVLERSALERLACLAAAQGPLSGRDDEQTAKGVAQFTDSNLIIAVIKRPCPTEKIPEIEQVLSTGAVCVTLLNAAAAEGYGANWLTGWAASDEVICREGLGLRPGEWVAGFIHLGTETSVPPDRPRPDLDKIVTWASV